MGDVYVLGLTIQSNVTVRFDGNYEFEVGGQLQVSGTASAPVIFTPSTTNGWKGILFRDATPGSFFNYATIERANRGGVRITNTSPVFTNCIIRNNTSQEGGGGICALVAGDTLIVQGCVISNNLAGPACSLDVWGGGIYANGPSLISQCTIISNQTLGYYGRGGGVAVSGSCTMRNCNIIGNIARGCSSEHGDGIYVNSGTFQMFNCTVANNGMQGEGGTAGGLRVENATASALNCIIASNVRQGVRTVNSSVSLVNCTLSANVEEGFYADNGTGRITNCIVYFNGSAAPQIGGATAVGYSDVQGGVQPGVGNISYAPALCPQNYSLVLGSPCIDAGSPDAAFNDICLDNGFCTPYSRGTARNDMGAYGGPGGCCWSTPCSALDILLDPQPLTACLNTPAAFAVGAAGSQPLTYQWRFHGTNSAGTPVNIVGATNAAYTIASVQNTNAGWYSVRVSNPTGNLDSSLALLTVTPVCVTADLFMGLNINGGVSGQPYTIFSTLSLSPPVTWTSNATITQTVSGVVWVDRSSPANMPKKFYKVTQ